MRSAGALPLLRIVAISGGATLLYAVAPLGGRRAPIFAILLVIALVGTLLPLAVVRARRILRSSQPLLDVVESLVTLLAVLVLGFATVYVMLASSPGQMRGVETKVDAVYYSVSVLSTVGFGDVTAEGQLARAVATVHMLFNLVFLATAARLLMWSFRQRAAGGPGSSLPRSAA